jgi:PAS domain S-box-containing protein/diguanylate cyclase (GGDEF)-like protein
MRLRQLAALLEHSQDATVAVDVEGRVSEWNPAAEAMLGWSRAEALDTPMREFVPPEGLADFDTTWTQLSAGGSERSYDADRLHRDGTRTPVSVHVIAVRADGEFAGTVATMRQQSPLAEPPRPVAAAPSVVTDGDQIGLLDDELIGLRGRRELLRLLGAPLREGTARGVAVLDVDAFELVNQTYGHEVGDEVLCELARRLAAAVGEGVVGRWQADEFMYLVDTQDPVADLEVVVAAALRAVRELFVLGEHRLRLSMSAGLVTTAVVAREELLRSASQALRVAKAGGRDRAVWFEGTPTAAPEAPPERLRLAEDVRRGIDAGEMRLHFQPIVELTSREVVGVEALVRWQRPGAGLLLPADFIEASERTGQIVPLGVWVTEQACRAAVVLRAFSRAPQSMSINLSARQLADPGVVDMLRDSLRVSGVVAGEIIIDVTETSLMEDMSAATATLDAIKALGVDLALDDYGTGYSSLLCLRDFPVDRIKLDQSFISGLGVDSDTTAIVASTVSLAHRVGVKVVAEGVETLDQLALLRQMGCDFAQGYLFSPPLTLEQLQKWLREQPPARRRRAAKAATASARLAPECSRILRLHGEGASLHTIAAALNVEGLRTPAGLRWSPQSVGKVITPPRKPAPALLR